MAPTWLPNCCPAFDIPYVAMNPGASFRGLHDSFVNFGDDHPKLIQCCHEEIAVAVALGYARATGKPMAAALHSMVGLQHGSMAIYNAWCERQPMLVLGGTGPVAAENRRNWIDWVHTALVQGNQVRDYVKWDDQPASLGDIAPSLLRAYRIAMTEPKGPTYLCYDTELQEKAIGGPTTLPPVERFRPGTPPSADREALDRVAALLAEASGRRSSRTRRDAIRKPCRNLKSSPSYLRARSCRWAATTSRRPPA